MQANRPAKAGSSSELAPLGNAAPPLGAVTPPPPVHHDLAPRDGAPRVGAPGATAGHRAARPTEPRQPRQPRDRIDPGVGPLAWLPYLIVLAGGAPRRVLPSNRSEVH